MITQEIWEGDTRAIDDLKSQLAEERAEIARLKALITEQSVEIKRLNKYVHIGPGIE